MFPNTALDPGTYTRAVFSNENIFIKLEESVRGKDVYLVQTMASPVHDNFMEMLIMIDALKRDSAWRINLVVPYMSYTRSDKKDQPRVPISARLVANIIETAGVDRYMTVDLHSGQIQGFFNIPGDALTAFHLLSDYVIQKIEGGELDDLVVVATDLGFAKQGRNWAEALGVPLAFVEKRRVGNAESPRALSLIGSVEGKNVLLVDDEVNTAGSVVNAGQRCSRKRRARCNFRLHSPLLFRIRLRALCLARSARDHLHQHLARPERQNTAQYDGAFHRGPAG